MSPNNRCSPCGRDFGHKISLMFHEHGKHGKYPKYESKCLPCSQCNRLFSWEISLLQHETFSLHNPKPKRRNQRKNFTNQVAVVDKSMTSKLTEYYNNNVVVSPNDRKQAKEKARRVITDLMARVRDMTDKDIYSYEIRAAGSTGTGTKVNLADEFDFNVPLNIDVGNVRQSTLTPGYYKVKPLRRSIGDEFIDNNGYIVPSTVQEHLHDHLKKAIQESRYSSQEVILQRKPNGPAVTLSIVDGTPGYRHHIDVDISPTLVAPTSLKLPQSTSERLRKVFRQKRDVLEELEQMPFIMVPKKPTEWFKSYSRHMKIFINHIDEPGECRKMCHKTLKYDILRIKSKRDFPGVSTYIFKHHFVWFCEKKSSVPGYWKSERFGECYAEMLKDLADQISSGRLRNFFNDSENILEGKDISVLRSLANELLSRRNEVLKW